MGTINVNSVNPYIRRAMSSIISDGMRIGQRVIFDYELVYIEKGKMSFEYAGITHSVQEGQFLFIHPGVPHTFICDTGDVSQPHIHFDIIYSSSSEKTPVGFKDYAQLDPEERAIIQKDLFSDFPVSPIVTFTNHKEAVELLRSVLLKKAALRKGNYDGADISHHKR